jgi:hypothetical protein
MKCKACGEVMLGQPPAFWYCPRLGKSVIASLREANAVAAEALRRFPWCMDPVQRARETKQRDWTETMVKARGQARAALEAS